MDTQRGRTGTADCHARCAEAKDQHRPACGFRYCRYLAYCKVVVPVRDPEAGGVSTVKVVAPGEECGSLCSATVVGGKCLKSKAFHAKELRIKGNCSAAGISIYRDRNTADGKKV